MGLRAPAAQGAGDIQYGIDILSEEGLPQLVAEELEEWLPLQLLSEGLARGGVLVGEGEPRTLVVIDPVDGTRGLMHDKRSAFALLAMGTLEGGSLRTLRSAAMVEIPTQRSELSDVIWVTRGSLVRAQTEHLGSGAISPLVLKPSGESELLHGFATIARFIGGAKGAIGAFEDRLLDALYPGDESAWSAIFEDQFISNGGQLHSLMTGRDLFVADLRPLFRTRSGGRILASHPYDLCCALLAEAVGVVLCDPAGRPLDCPMDLTTDVAWVAYANEGLRERIEPLLLPLIADLARR